MIYVVGDIHGQYTKFLRLLQKIDLKEDDILYTIGDIVDRGPSGLKTLLFMSEDPRIIPILGNHDYLFAYIAQKLLTQEVTDIFLDQLAPEDLALLQIWLQNGGTSTLKEYQQLSKPQRELVLEYIKEFSLFEEVEVNGTDYVLVHGGLGNFSPDKPLEDYDLADLIDVRADYSKIYYPDKILVTGHTPTDFIQGHPSGLIYRKNNHIALDTGAGFDQYLSAFCLDTGEEFYID